MLLCLGSINANKDTSISDFESLTYRFFILKANDFLFAFSIFINEFFIKQRTLIVVII